MPFPTGYNPPRAVPLPSGTPAGEAFTIGAMHQRILIMEAALATIEIEAAHALANRIGPTPADQALTRESLAAIVSTARLATTGGR